MKLLGRNDHFLVIIGPSASGKSTILNQLIHNEKVELTPSWTTRPRRNDEQENIEHVFCTDKEFLRKQSQGRFLETVKLFNLNYHYGLTKITHNYKQRVPVIMLRSMLINKLAVYYKNFTIYQIEAEANLIEERLALRDAKVGTRLTNYQEEVRAGRELADRIYESKSLGKTIKQIPNDLVTDFPEYLSSR